MAKTGLHVSSNKDGIKTKEDFALVGKLLNETIIAYKKEKVHSNVELMQRLSDYFTFCADNECTPTVEELAMWTGYSSQTVWDWEKENTRPFKDSEFRTSEIIKKAKNFIATFDAKLVVKGKLNPVSYIFRAKNYYGMADKQEITVAPANPLGDGASQEEIAQRLLSTTEVIDE